MLNELLTLLLSCECSGPVAAPEIADAERALDVVFPVSYREFVSRFGSAVARGASLAGLPGPQPDCPFWDDVVGSTLQMRNASGSDLPHALIWITSDGGDYVFYLDTARMLDGECPVVVRGPGRDDVVVADSFGQFAVLWMRHELEY